MKLREVIIVGVGLIGSSIGRDLVRKRMARKVIGVGRNRANLQAALKERAIHEAVVLKNPRGIRKVISKETDLVILATPVSTIRNYLKALRHTKVVVMDVGSSKRSIVREAKRLRFIPAHPIAGTEKSGAKGGEEGLFRGRKCLLIRPLQKELRRFAHQFWRALGSEVIEMDGVTHDRVLAAVSHLPHAVAYSLVRAIAKKVSVKNETRFALGGLRDTVRIAASPPEMWADIFLENRPHVVGALRQYLRELSRLQGLIRERDRKGLLKFLREAQSIRLKIR